MSRLRWSRRKKLAAGLGVTACLLGVAEVGARIGYRDRWPYHLLYDDDLLWRHRPGWRGWVRGDAWAEFDRHGLRESRDLAAIPKRPRVLILGDSIAFGYALQQGETIAVRLEEQWNAAHAKAPLTVVNGGVSGYATEQETAWLNRIAPAVEPRLIVLLLCMSNDVSVESVAGAVARQSAFNPGRKRLAVRNQLLRGLLDHSALAFALTRKIDRALVRAGRQHQAEAARAAGQQGLKFSNLSDFTKLPPAERLAEYALLERRLRAFKAAAQRAGAPSVLVICPSEDLLNGDPEPVADVVALGRRIGLPTLDLLPHYRTQRDGLLRPRDGIHPTAAGAKRIAGWLIAFLKRERLLPLSD